MPSINLTRELKLIDSHRDSVSKSQDDSLELELLREKLKRDFLLNRPLGYQSRWLADDAQVKIAEKSRRIGLSWIEALDCVLWANRSDGFNSYYIGYNFEMSEQFIADCAGWAKALGAIAGDLTGEFGEVDSFIDEDNILNYRLRFKNGRQIVALSSKPTNLRSKKGRIVIDEVAFHNNVDELIKAAMAITIWGGQLRLISTHDGEDNPFNDLVKEAQDKGVYSLHRITFKDAIGEGLFKRICAVQDNTWSLERELAWEIEIRALYGVGASEELDVVPSVVGAGLVFSRSWFESITEQENFEALLPSLGVIYVRFWDLAATEKKLSGNNPCYTAGVKMALYQGMYYVLDCIYVQLGPADIDDVILSAAALDGDECAIRWELEGGSSGVRDAAHIAKLLDGYDAQAIRPRGDKVKRARPWASQLKAGNARLIKGAWNKEYIKRHVGFPDGFIDVVDASSGAYDHLSTGVPQAKDFYVTNTPLTPQARLRRLTEKARRRRR